MISLKKVRNRIIILFFSIAALLFISISVSGAEYLQKLRIKTVEVITLNLQESYEFDDYYISSDPTIFKIEDKEGISLKEGTVILTKNNKKEKEYIVNVIAKYDSIVIEGTLMIDKGETTKLKATVVPTSLEQSVIWKSNDESVATISNDGTVNAIDYGITTITATSTVDNSCVGSTVILVDNDSLENYEPIIKNEYMEPQTKKIKASDLTALLESLINTATKSVVGVEKFVYSGSNRMGKILGSTGFASGVIYRRDAILNDGTIIENVEDSTNIENLSKYRYYVVTNRHIIQNADVLKIYLGDDIDEIEATLVQYDDKIDLSVVTFDSTIYLPTVIIGDSDNIKRGEFVIAIGNSYGKEYFRNATFGVISYTKRYVATDTDDDNVSDWDSEYIQHDASINDGDNGGALINMKGELIGINTTKLSTLTIDNMSFAIPTNLALEIVEMLEKGIKPERPLLGVSIIDILTYYQQKSYYAQNYPELLENVPDGLEYGFYINEVNAGGVAEAAGVQVGDILIEFNGVPTKYSYNIRAELGKFIIGSGQTAELKVLRNGEEVTLSVTF